MTTDQSERGTGSRDTSTHPHWLQVTNIPGNNVELGNEMFSYVPPLALQFEGGEIDKSYPAHNSPLLVFEQEDKVGRIGLGFTVDTRK